MPTIQQLEEGIRRADAAGDTESVRVLGRELRKLQAQGGAAINWNASAKGPARTQQGSQRKSSFMQGLRETGGNALANYQWMMDALQGRTIAKAITGQPTPSDIVRAQVRKQKERAPDEGSAGGRITGDILGSIPAMAVPGGPFIQGAAAGGMVTQDPNDTLGLLRDAFVGGVSGKGSDLAGRYVVAPAARAVAKPFTAALGAMRNAPAPQVADDIAALGPEALARAERFSRVGVQKPTTAMVTRNPTAWTRERNLQALTEGQPLKEGLLQVQDDLYNAGQNLSQGAPGRESVGANVRNIVKGRSKRLQQEVSALYTRARETFGDVPVKLDKLWSTMADPGFRNNSKFGHMNDQVTGLLKDFGVIDDVGANIPGKDLTLGQANELRKFIGNLGDGADPTVKAARKMLQTALDTDALGNVGDDAFRAARSAAHARFSEFESGLTSKMAEQKMFDEALPSRIAQGGVSNQQVRDLYKTLAAEGEPGQQAINQLRRQVVADMVNDPRVIMNDGTTVAINGKTLWNNFTKNKDRLKVVLGDDMFRQFDDFVAATRDATVQPALATPNTSNTAAMLLNGKQGLLDQAFAPPDESIGMLARKAPAIGAGLGGLLGYAGGPVSASGGATAGALAGQGVKKIAEQRAAARAAEATQRQIAQSLEPRSAAEALRMLEQTNLDDATRQAIIAKWGHILGIGSAGASVGLLPAR